ncbi:MAG: arsenic resistance protein [Deferrisomatales bacterium]
MTRETLERHQVHVYLAAVSLGLLAGRVFPGGVAPWEVALWPLLGVLLYTTFTQVPLAHLREAIAEPRFLAAAILGNFAVLPFAAWGLAALAPGDPAVRLGVLLVLLVPCTDWFITFTHLGGGETRRALAFAPVSLFLQFLLLPLYLALFYGDGLGVALARREMFLAFGGLIAAPLAAAFLTERWAEGRPGGAVLLARLGWFPVPLLAAVVFLIAATQVGLVLGSAPLLGALALVFAAFLVLAGALARVLAGLFRLPTPQGRALAFSFGTRNSFVVLPLALALPASFEVTAVVVVFQSLVELLGMAAFLWLVPRVLFPGRP